MSTQISLACSITFLVTCGYLEEKTITVGQVLGIFTNYECMTIFGHWLDLSGIQYQLVTVIQWYCMRVVRQCMYSEAGTVIELFSMICLRCIVTELVGRRFHPGHLPNLRLEWDMHAWYIGTA